MFACFGWVAYCLKFVVGGLLLTVWFCIVAVYLLLLLWYFAVGCCCLLCSCVGSVVVACLGWVLCWLFLLLG